VKVLKSGDKKRNGRFNDVMNIQKGETEKIGVRGHGGGFLSVCSGLVWSGRCLAAGRLIWQRRESAKMQHRRSTQTDETKGRRGRKLITIAASNVRKTCTISNFEHKKT